jgi:hypothetical protein
MGLLDDAIREHLELKRKHGASDDELARAEVEALAPARRDAAAAAGAGVPPIERVPGTDEPPLSGEAPPSVPAATDAPPPPDLDVPPAEPAADVGVPDQPTAIRQVPEQPPVDEPAYADGDDDEVAAAAPLPPSDEQDPDAAPPPSRPLAYEDDDDYLAPEPLGEGPAAHPPLESTEPIEAPELERFAEPAAPPPDEDEPDPDEVPVDEAPGPKGDPYRARTSILDDPLAEPPPPAADPAAEGDPDVLEETPDFLQETPEHDKLWFEQKPPRDFDFD